MYWYMEVMRKYSVFAGRARRKEYWIFHLVNLFVVVILAFCGALLMPSMIAHGASPGAALIWLIPFVAYVLATIIPSLAVSVRRLHDTNLSGWWLLIGLVPLGGLILFVFHLLDSNPGTNRYGPNPKGIVAAYPEPSAPQGTQAMASAAGAGATAPGAQWFLGFCNSCGTSMQAGTRFCPKCGKAAY